MALGASGLKTYMWNNTWKSVALLALFPVFLLLVVFALSLLVAAFGAGDGKSLNLAEGFEFATAMTPRAAPFAFAGAAVWFGIALFAHQAIIDAATGAKAVSREDEPELYNLLENLCISRGLPMPTLRIIEHGAMNAFASGLSERNYTISVTRGLMVNLERDELEAVLAHELSHIRHRDVRLLVIAVIFVGIISFVFEIVFRGLTRSNMHRTDRHRRSGGGQAGAMIFIALAILAIAYVLALAVRFALSRRREYLADAGAAELTRNPDAMVRALEKVAGHATLPQAPAEVREMFLENEAVGFQGLFATHPPIEKRIEALRQFGGVEI